MIDVVMSHAGMIERSTPATLVVEPSVEVLFPVSPDLTISENTADDGEIELLSNATRLIPVGVVGVIDAAALAKHANNKELSFVMVIDGAGSGFRPVATEPIEPNVPPRMAIKCTFKV